MELNTLYDIAESNNIPIYDMELEHKALSVKLSGKCHIAMDNTKLPTTAERKVSLAHELSHCITDSFINTMSTFDTAGRVEHRAVSKSYEMLIPIEAIKRLWQLGYTEEWQIAEELSLTCEFVRSAVLFYKDKGIL